jgi:hypothetical protein
MAAYAVPGRICSTVECAAPRRVCPTAACATPGRVSSTEVCTVPGCVCVSVLQQFVLSLSLPEDVKTVKMYLSGSQNVKIMKLKNPLVLFKNIISRSRYNREIWRMVMHILGELCKATGHKRFFMNSFLQFTLYFLFSTMNNRK